MALIRPRLNDYYELTFNQSNADFAIPYLDEDIPLYLDPFLLWCSPSLQDNSLHSALTDTFNYCGYLFSNGNETEAISIIKIVSECNEVGLGNSKTRKGLPIGENTAFDILNVFKVIPQLKKNGFVHFEEIQLLVDNIGKDRISDIACNFIKSFLIDFTLEQIEKYHIPTKKHTINIFNYPKKKFIDEEVFLPENPEIHTPIILVPKRWLRTVPWLSYDDYYHKFFITKDDVPKYSQGERIKVLNYNRYNYGLIKNYTEVKEKFAFDCSSNNIFDPISTTSAKRKLSTLLKLPTGNKNKSDKIFEDLISQLMSSILFPQLDFAKDQSRTVSGKLIRDLIFYNNRTYDFLNDIYQLYKSRQIVFEIKNVEKLEREHINQLNRYLNDQFGSFGIIVTRKKIPVNIYKNAIDLWSGQRKVIITIDDSDISQMVQLFVSKQRLPIDVIKKKYIEFSRSCPS